MMKKNIYTCIYLFMFSIPFHGTLEIFVKNSSIERSFFFFFSIFQWILFVCLFCLFDLFFSSFLSFLFLYIYIFFFGSKCTNADRYEKYYLLFRDITTEIWELDISRLIFFITSTNSGIKVGIERACFSNICVHVRLCMFIYIYIVFAYVACVQKRCKPNLKCIFTGVRV